MKRIKTAIKELVTMAMVGAFMFGIINGVIPFIKEVVCR